jgi:hypothetical protein
VSCLGEFDWPKVGEFEVAIRVLVRDRGNLLRHGEDDMEILNREQFSLPFFKPASA